jgi:hypothetical protein
MALINRSGTRGLSAFLPDKDELFAMAEDDNNAQPPHLPLTDSWKDTDFSLASVMSAAPGPVVDGKIEIRTWTELLLSRYLYMSGKFAFLSTKQPTHPAPISGDSPSHFASLYGVSDSNRTFEFLRAHEELGMICLNDDESEAASEEIGRLQHDWLESRWPERVWWERLT